MILLKSKLTYYIVMILVLFAFLVFALNKLNSTINTLHYKLTYLFEKELNTKVSIGKIEGDFVSKLILNDVIIYHEFRDDMSLVEAKTVTIEFNLVTAILKDSIPIKNIKKIGVYDYVVNIDEYFTKTQAVQSLVGKDDGIDRKPSFIVEIKRGVVNSAFLNKNLGSFKGSNVECTFSKKPTSFAFDGKGIIEGDKVYGNTKTPFRIKANDSIKKGEMRGTLDVGNINYLGYHFKALALDFLLSGERINFHIKPTKHKEYLAKLPKEHLESYKNKNPYNYLIDLKFEYLLNENEIYIDVDTKTESIATKEIIYAFLKKENLSKYFLNKSKWQLFGHALFRLRNGEFTDVNIRITRASNVFAKDDDIRVFINRKKDFHKQAILKFNKLLYKSPEGGIIKGNLAIFDDRKIDTVNIDIKKLYIKPFIEIMRKGNLLKKPTDNNIKAISLPKKKIFSEDSIISSKIRLGTKQHKHYLFTMSDNIVSNLTLPNIAGTIEHKDDNTLYINLTGTKYIDFLIKARLNLKNLRAIPFHLNLKETNYEYAKRVLNIKTQKNYAYLRELYFRGQFSGSILTYNLSESYIKGKAQVYSTLKYQANNTLAKANDSKTLIQKANIDLMFKGGNLYFNRSYLNDLDIYFKGTVSKRNQRYYPEITFSYKGINIYIDGYIYKKNAAYRTKINLIYDNFKTQLTSIISDIQIVKQSKIILRNASLRHNQKQFDLRGMIDIGDNFIKPSIILLNKEGKAYLDFRAIFALSKKKNGKTKLRKSINLNYDDVKYSIEGDVVFGDDILTPNLAIVRVDRKGSRQELTLNGSMQKENNNINALLKGVYNKSPFDINSSVRYSKNKFDIVFNIFEGRDDNSDHKENIKENNSNIITYELEKKKRSKERLSLFGFRGEIGAFPLQDDAFFIKGKVNIKDYSSYINTSVSFKGRTIYSSLEFTLKSGHRALLTGYVTFADIYYFPYFRLVIFPKVKTDKVYIPFIFEGKITDNKDAYNIDLIVNKRAYIRGNLTKYSLLELNILFNNYPITLIEDFNFQVYNRFTDSRGIYLKLDEKGLLLDGNISIKELMLIKGEDDFQIDSKVHYYFPFRSNAKTTKQTINFTTNFLKNNKAIIGAKGSLSYEDEGLELKLETPKKEIEIALLYYDRDNLFLNLGFNNFSIGSIYTKMKGSLKGKVSLEGALSNPKIVSNNLSIKDGLLNDTYFNTNFSLEKTDNTIKINKAYVFIEPGIELRLSDLIYKSPDKISSLLASINELNPRSTLSIKNLILKYKYTKLILSDFIYNTGNKKLSLFDNNNLLLSLIDNTNTYANFNFKHATLLYKQNTAIAFDNFYFRPGKYWRLDFDTKIKANIFSDRYTGKFLVFGGRSSANEAEINILGKKMRRNKEYYKDLELIGKARGNKWDIFVNRENFSIDEFIIDNTKLKYSLKYADDLSSLFSRGFIDLKNSTLDINSSLINKDLSKSKIMQSLFIDPTGSFDAVFDITGKISDPYIEGKLKLSKGNFKLKDDDEDAENSLDNINLEILFSKDKQYNTGLVSYNHYISLNTGYKKGIINIDGYFNTKEWFLDNFDIRLQTFKDIDLKLANNLIKYDGELGADFNLSGDFASTKKLDGSIFLKKANISYIGSKSNIEGSFLDTLNLDILRIYITEDVTVNIGKGNLSLGEVILKEYNVDNKTGSYLTVKKTGATEDEFTLNGTLEAKKGEFDYLGNIFSIVKAKVAFSPTEKPQISLKAKTKRIRDENNRTVTVYMNIEDELEKLFKEDKKKSKEDKNILIESLSSSPAKSKEEIAILLGYGGNQTTDEYLAQQNYYNSGKTANILLNLILVKPIERKLKEVFGIDSFNIKQSILQNTIFNYNIDNSYSNLDDKGKEIHFLSDTEITVGKYLSFISDSLFLSGGLMLLRDTNPTKVGQLKKVWKVSLEAGLLPLFGVDSDRVQLNLGTEYQYRQDEIYQSERHEGVFKFGLSVEF